MGCCCKKQNKICIITTVFNPAGFQTRAKLHNDFIKRFAKQKKDVMLVVVECAYQNDQFMFTQPNKEPYQIQIRAQSRIWHKENLINIALIKLMDNPKFMDCQYVAWVDDDIEFIESNWAESVRNSLQKYSIIQMFQTCRFLDDKNMQLELFTSLGYYYATDRNRVMNVLANQLFSINYYPHPGFAWCTTKQNMIKIGSLIDFCILGNGDRHMSNAIVGLADQSIPKGYKMSPGYYQCMKQWEDKSIDVFGKNLGYAPITINHYWHGSRQDRQYMYRWQLLAQLQYDPNIHIVRMQDGHLELVQSQQGEVIRQEIFKYFTMRKEDNTNSQQQQIKNPQQQKQNPNQQKQKQKDDQQQHKNKNKKNQIIAIDSYRGTDFY